MKVLAFQIGLMVLATLVAGLCCALVAAAWAGGASASAAVAAMSASLIPGTAVIVFFHLSRPTVSAVLIGMMLRLGLTIAIGGLLALALAWLQSPVYFLTLGVVYLANLAVETWFILQKNRQSERLSPSN